MGALGGRHATRIRVVGLRYASHGLFRSPYFSDVLRSSSTTFSQGNHIRIRRSDDASMPKSSLSTAQIGLLCGANALPDDERTQIPGAGRLP